MPVFFNGRLLVSPSVESAVYDQGLAGSSIGREGNIPVMIGTSDGGKPKTLLLFDSPVTAQRELRGGDLLRAVEAAFNPSVETGSPARVGVVRIEAATPSALALKDSGGATVIALTSIAYGAHANALRVTVESGSSIGKRLTVRDGDRFASQDNIARTALTVRYTGAEATATVDVTATTMVLKAPSGGAGVTLTLANYRSVRELADAINAVAGFSAVAVVPTHPVVAALDGMTGGNAKNLDLAVKADLQACIDWLNTGARELVSAARGAAAINPPANLATTYLAGGSNGAAPTPDDWQDAFDALQSADVRYIVPLSDSPAVWDMADAHVQFMSTAGQSERRAFVGGGVPSGALAAAIDAAKAAAAVLNSDRTSLVFPGVLDYDEAGNLEALPAYFLAARVAGGFGAINPGETMTNKVLNVVGLEPVVAAVADMDSLVSGGVLAVKAGKRGPTVVKAISTWLGSSNYNRVEVSTGTALDFVMQAVRAELDSFIGRKASPITLHEAMAVTDSVLRDLARPVPMGLGVIVGDAASPAYRNIVAEITGDVLRVHFECSPVVPLNYVLVGVHAKAYSGSVSSVAVNI